MAAEKTLIGNLPLRSQVARESISRSSSAASDLAASRFNWLSLQKSLETMKHCSGDGRLPGCYLQSSSSQ